MRKLKKMLAMLSAAAVLCGSAVSMQVGAVNNYDCDVNNDGSVDILDTMAVNQYLLGVFYVSDPAVMDVNGNLIVDQADAYCVMSAITHSPYACELI